MSSHSQAERNWKVNLAAAWVAQFLAIVGFDAAFPFLPFYVRELGVTGDAQVKMWAGLLASVASVSMAVVSPMWGVLADRRGRKLMVERATFGGAVILTAMAFAGNVHQLLILRLIQGTLTGTIPAFVTLVAASTPASQVGFALGMLQVAVFSGSTVGPMIGGFVADQVGYRWTFGVTGILLLLGGILVHFVVREKFVAPKERSAQNGITVSARTIVRSLPVMGAVMALAGISAGSSTSAPMVPLLVETFQHDPNLINTATGAVYGASAIASAVSAAVIGRVSDRSGPRRVLLVCGVGVALTYVGQAFAPSLALLIGASFVTGLFAGGLPPAANSVLARAVPQEQQGGVYGLSNSLNATGRAVGPMLGAAVATAWGLPAAFLAATALFGLMTAWVAASIKPERKPAPQAEPAA